MTAIDQGLRLFLRTFLYLFLSRRTFKDQNSMSNSDNLNIVIWYVETRILVYNSFLALGKYFTNSIFREVLYM